MNLRDIKKDIEYVIGAFVDDCTLVLSVHKGDDVDEVAGLIDEAVDLFNDLRNRSVNPEGNKRAWSSGEGNGNPLQYSGLENSHGQRSLAGYSPWGCRVRHD